MHAVNGEILSWENSEGLEEEDTLEESTSFLGEELALRSNRHCAD